MTTELPQNIKSGSSETQIDKSTSSWLPPGLALQKVDERIMTLNVGPQHPGSGHMRLIVQIDGDYIVACDPDPGYVHRGEENPIPGSDATKLPTLRDIFYSVEFHEREIFEMFGVYFEGHPDNRRLLLPEDWADLPPLRKDFAIKGR